MKRATAIQTTVTRPASAYITQQDFLKMREEGGGFGYLCHTIRTPEAWADTAAPYEAVRILDEALLNAANDLMLLPENLFDYLNSRDARHDADAAYGKPLEIAVQVMLKGLARYTQGV